MFPALVTVQNGPLSKKYWYGLAMEREAAQNWSEAEKIYNIMLNDDPANLHIKKRIISMKKAQGKGIFN